MIQEWDIAGKIVFPVLVAIVVALINKRLEYRPKLIMYVAHAAGFALPPQPASLPAPATASPLAAADEAEGNFEPREDSASNPTSGSGQAQVPGVQLHVHGIAVRNAGKKTAFNVRIGHNLKVHHYTIEPRVKHDTFEGPDGGWEILIPSLVPNEQVLISYLYFPPIVWSQIHSYTKSDEGFARYLNVLPTPLPPRWLIVVFGFFFYFGIAALAYFAVAAIQWLVVVTSALAR
ncbi:hypothetical protein [Cupriavidus sp. DL-D2]|uniref:hypothetical protein n=1 Tax=Cupriavidus sp. DL-D2 TaxID=3144974 RepID=UPI003214ECEE